MTRDRRLIYLICSRGRARLVTHDAARDMFKTVESFTCPSGAGLASPEHFHRLVERIREHMARARYEGLFLVAPPVEIEALRERLERSFIVLGGLDSDATDLEEEALSSLLEPTLRTPYPER